MVTEVKILQELQVYLYYNDWKKFVLLQDRFLLY